MLRPPSLPGLDSTERSAPRALCFAAATSSRGRGFSCPASAPPEHTHRCLEPTNPEAALAGSPPPRGSASFLACMRRISPKSSATRFQTHLGSGSTRARGGGIVRGGKGELPSFKDATSCGRRFSGSAYPKGRLLTTQPSKVHPAAPPPPIPPLNQLDSKGRNFPTKCCPRPGAPGIRTSSVRVRGGRGRERLRMETK